MHALGQLSPVGRGCRCALDVIAGPSVVELCQFVAISSQDISRLNGMIPRLRCRSEANIPLIGLPFSGTVAVLDIVCTDGISSERFG